MWWTLEERGRRWFKRDKRLLLNTGVEVKSSFVVHMLFGTLDPLPVL
jgi:hypothetical protein